MTKCSVVSVAFLWAGLLVGGAAKAGQCEVNFMSSKTPEGALMVGAVLPTSGYTTSGALAEIERAAKARGHDVVRTQESAGETLNISPSASNPKWLFMLANASQGSVSLSAISPPEMGARPEEMRTLVCGLLAKLEAKPATTPKVARVDEHGIEQSRGVVPDKTPQINTLHPTRVFDLQATKAALEPGTAIIKGKVCAWADGRQYAMSGEKIYLYPATPYLEEVVSLMHKAKPGRDRVEFSVAMTALRIEGESDADGNYQFSKMSPGRYYIAMESSFSARLTRNVSVGTAYYSNGFATDIVGKESYTKDYDVTLEKFVEVKSAGQVVKANIQPRSRLGNVQLGCSKIWTW